MNAPASHEGEIRLNKVTRQWVIIAPSRGDRPRQFAQRHGKGKVPPHDPQCPFCPGNEARLTRIVQETGTGSDGWQTRVVDNKFPALRPDGPAERMRDGIYLKMSALGRHEVVIETPRHDRQPGAMTAGEVEAVVDACHRRYRDLMDQEGHMLILIFRNHGRRAGTSLVHPHSQIVATRMVPQPVRRQEDEARRYFDEWSRCLLCRILDFESRSGARLVYENDAFIGFVPFAAEVPFEVWIAPRHHHADFGSLDGHGKASLAEALQWVLKRLADKLGDPDYNYVINSATRHQGGEAPHLHWYLRITPRLTTRAGFELGTGISINPSLPEADAAFLR